MEGPLKQSTAVNVTVTMIDSADHVAGKTGLTLTIYATKAGGTPAAITPTVTELDSTHCPGLYALALTTTHTNTLGELQLHITGTGADPADLKWQVSTYLPGEAATLQADQAVNTTKIGGTSQTARDIGASVLLSTGTGTGQLDFTSGVVKANLAQILGTALTETAGLLAGGFKKFFNIATPASTMDALTLVTTATNLTNAPTSGDLTAAMKASVTTAATAATPTAAAVTARVTANTDQLAGQTVTAAAGVTFPASVASPTNITAGTITTATNLTNAPTAGDFTATMKTSIGTAVAASAVASVTGNVGGNVTGSVGSVSGNVGGNVSGSVGSVASGGIAAASFAANAITATAIASNAITAAKVATDAIGAAQLAADAVTEIQSGLSTLNAAGVRTAVGLGSANLDTQLAAIDAVTEKLDTALELDTGAYRFTTAALAEAPTGGGGGISAGDVWDVPLADHQTSGSVGEALSNAGASGSPIDALVEGDKTMKDVLKLQLAYVVGKTSVQKLSGKRAQATYRNYSDTKDSIVAQVNGSARESVVVDP